MLQGIGVPLSGFGLLRTMTRLHDPRLTSRRAWISLCLSSTCTELWSKMVYG